MAILSKKKSTPAMEMSGDKKPSLAIALSVQQKNKKKMAKGGKVSEGTNDKEEVSKENDTKELKDSKWTDNKSDSTKNEKPETDGKSEVDESPSHSEVETREQMLERHASELDGLYSDDDEMPVPHKAPGSIAESIMAKGKKMASGGMVDLNANSEESPNMEDKYSFEANGKEQYDLDQLSGQPKDSNEHGDSREMSHENMDDESLVDAIRAKLKAKRGE